MSYGHPGIPPVTPDGMPAVHARPGHALTPDDPLYAVVAAVTAMQRQAHKELALLVAKQAEDIAATSVLAENAARAKAEMIITQAGEWSAGQIRKAGSDVATALIAERVVREVSHDAFLSRLVWFTIGAALIGGGCVAGLTLAAEHIVG